MNQKEEELKKMCAIHVADHKQENGLELTDDETRFTAEREPDIGLRIVQAPGMSKGRQSRVSVLAYERGGEERRVVWKRMGVGKGLTPAEAAEMWERLDHYRDKLVGVGWRVPRLLYSTVVPTDSGEAQIYSYEQYISGGDAQVMLEDPEQPNFRKWYFVREVLRTLYTYPPESLTREEAAGREVSRLPDGLDLKAANFVLEEDSDELFFIDLFGTKELTPEGGWLTYTPKIDPLPADNLKAVCATREGAILRFWRLARRLWKPRKADRVALTNEFLDVLATVEPPEEEFEFIRDEIESGCPWMDRLYEEHLV